MKIPKDSVGLVIGRQGANIREIQVLVNCDVGNEICDICSIGFRRRPRRGSTSEMSSRRRNTGWRPSGWTSRLYSVTLRSRHGHTFGGIIIILSQRQPRWRPACRNTHTSNIGAAAQVWRTRFISLPLYGQAIHHSSRVETVVMEVPSRNVGRVIGRRGETVNIRIHILT